MTANLGFNQKYIFEREGRVLLNIFFLKGKTGTTICSKKLNNQF